MAASVPDEREQAAVSLLPLPNFRSGPDRELALAQYRRLAAGYEATCSHILPIRTAAIRALRLKPGETVFDIACDTGATLISLAHRVRAKGVVIGVEQSPQMAGVAQRRVADAAPAATVRIVVASVEDAPLPAPADAILLCYTHDVLQNPRAVEHLMRHAKPGARVAVAGMKFLPWWWGAPLNLFSACRARHYLTTYQGMTAPWQPLLAYCPDLRVLRSFHAGTSYLAVGTVGRETRARPD